MLDFFHVYMYFLGQIDRDQICCNRYMMLYSSKPQHRESGLMCSGSMDDVDKTEHFLPETNNHPTLSIPHSGFCPLNGASIGPSLAALPFSAEAAFPYIVCNISYFLLSCKIRLLHIGWKKKKVVNFCTTFKMNLQIMKKWVSPIRTHPWRKRWDSNPRRVAPRWFSRPVHSTTLPHFRRQTSFAFYRSNEKKSTGIACSGKSGKNVLSARLDAPKRACRRDWACPRALRADSLRT